MLPTENFFAIRRRDTLLDLNPVELIQILGTCGQCYKASLIVIYESRVVNISNLVVITTLES